MIYMSCRENVVRNTFLSRRRGTLLNWRTEEMSELFVTTRCGLPNPSRYIRCRDDYSHRLEFSGSCQYEFLKLIITGFWKICIKLKLEAHSAYCLKMRKEKFVEIYSSFELNFRQWNNQIFGINSTWNMRAFLIVNLFEEYIRILSSNNYFL